MKRAAHLALTAARRGLATDAGRGAGDVAAPAFRGRGRGRPSGDRGAGGVTSRCEGGRSVAGEGGAPLPIAAADATPSSF
jgi:hypothetical protein